MTIGRRRGAAAALLAVAVVGLAACSDDPEPTFASPSSSPSATESASAPVKEPWEKKTDAGAVAFAKHWVNVFNEAQQTGDTDALRSLSHPSCGTCSGFASMLDDLYSDGGSLDSQGWKVVSVAQAPGVPLDQSRVSLRVDRSAQVVRYGDGRDPERFAESEVTLSAKLAWQSDGWLMLDLVAPQ